MSMLLVNSIFFLTLLFASVSPVNYRDPWALFPPESQWIRIIKTLKTDTAVKEYVKFYLEPFKQLQAAERDLSRDVEKIRGCLGAAIDVALDAIGRFDFDHDVFDARDYNDMHAILTLSMNAFNTTKAGKMEPLFTKQAVQYWMKQRLNDLVIGNDKFGRFARNRSDLITTIRSWRAHIKGLHHDEIRQIVPTIIDLAEVQRVLERDLQKLKRKGVKAKALDRNRIIRKIKTFDNHGGLPVRKAGTGLLMAIAIMAVSIIYV